MFETWFIEILNERQGNEREGHVQQQRAGNACTMDPICFHFCSLLLWDVAVCLIHDQPASLSRQRDISALLPPVNNKSLSAMVRFVAFFVHGEKEETWTNGVQISHGGGEVGLDVYTDH